MGRDWGWEGAKSWSILLTPPPHTTPNPITPRGVGVLLMIRGEGVAFDVSAEFMGRPYRLLLREGELGSKQVAQTPSQR